MAVMVGVEWCAPPARLYQRRAGGAHHSAGVETGETIARRGSRGTEALGRERIMEQLLQEFETPVVDTAGTIYRVFLYGRSRPADTWQGWLVFERVSDGRRFSTDVETTQPDAQAVLYWASGLTDAYFDGALVRALQPVVGGDALTRGRRLSALERAVLNCFGRYRKTHLLTQTVLGELRYATADIVRTLQDLEKGGLLIRTTDEGNDWVSLTGAGVEEAGLGDRSVYGHDPGNAFTS